MQRKGPKVWSCRGRTVTFALPAVMGIVNATPDSFYVGGRTPDPDEAIARGCRHFADGAAILDVGGESTRPGAEPVAPDEEAARVVPVIRGLRAACPEALISVDTRRTSVARAALEAGADIINDVSGCNPDEGMWDLVAASGAGYVLMHMRGDPKTMDSLTDYGDVETAVAGALVSCAARLEAKGARPAQIMLDPGLGFAKTHRDSLRLLAATERFAALPYPWLVAASRKRFLGEIAGCPDAEARGPASVGAALWAIGQGADAVRVHDVRETVQAMRVFLAAQAVAQTEAPTPREEA